MNGIGLIAAERQRQIEVEGFRPHNDDSYVHDELIRAAIAYIEFRPGKRPDGPPMGWPWNAEWWKPSDDLIRNYAKAGALIAAEIDRRQRLAGETTGGGWVMGESDGVGCTWTQDGEGSDTWAAECGGTFCLLEDGPFDNGMRFCCYCGKALKETPFIPECDDGE